MTPKENIHKLSDPTSGVLRCRRTGRRLTYGNPALSPGWPLEHNLFFHQQILVGTPV